MGQGEGGAKVFFGFLSSALVGSEVGELVEGGELVGDQSRGLGVDPPDQVVIGGVAVGVLGDQLGLADPAHPVHRPDRHRRSRGELGGEVREVPRRRSIFNCKKN